MKILGIETSCDDTAVSVIETDGKNVDVLGNNIHSQIEMHRPYGGVFPTLAKREHSKNLIPVLSKTLKEANLLNSKETKIADVKKILEREPELLKTFLDFIPTIEKPDIDLIAVTQGPGLEPALWVGISFAKALSAVWNIPIVPVNHMEGHILISLLKKQSENVPTINPPATPSLAWRAGYELSTINHPTLALLISGGHTEMVLMEKIGNYKIIGKTRDDAIGECFDKIARLMNLPYPGGPEISKLAERARKENITSPFPLPRPMIWSKDFDFSFSGLKTAVRYAIEKQPKLTGDMIAGISREVEDAITDVIVAKLKMAHDEYSYKSLIAGGGVIANIHIREALKQFATKRQIKLYLPQVSHSTDNALMISIAGYLKYTKNNQQENDFRADGNLMLKNVV